MQLGRVMPDENWYAANDQRQNLFLNPRPLPLAGEGVFPGKNFKRIQKAPSP
jgi:hypothetical protein